MDDFQLALQLQREFDEEWRKNLNVIKEETDTRKTDEDVSIVSSDWEITDPNPDIFNLFAIFNKKFFWGKLDCVEVKWSPRMYSCAGICTYKGAGGCVVSLSLPLLKLRPRKDLIETLLHEMIHAYLFVTKNHKDRNDHGPEFHKHMFRINKEAGTRITVYHNFHDEVRHYKTHWWRCDGPCRERKPFFGLVKRAMNRPPGPNDFWFQEHELTCGGKFLKIKEPEGFKSRKNQKSDKPDNRGEMRKKKTGSRERKTKSGVPSNHKDLITYLSGISAEVSNASGTSKIKAGITTPALSHFKSQDSGKRGLPLKSNSGGTVIINSRESKSKPEEKEENFRRQLDRFQPFSGVGHRLSPHGTLVDKSRSRLLSLYDKKDPADTGSAGPSCAKMPRVETDLGPAKDISEKCNNMELDETKDEASSEEEETNLHIISCPVCNFPVQHSVLNEHLDSACVSLDSVFENTESTIDLTDEPEMEVDGDSEVDDNKVKCPCCETICSPREINAHLDECLMM